MATISDYSEQAQLSQAAYASGLIKDMSGGGNTGDPSDYADLLIDGGMSETQAIDFANKYTVVDLYEDPESGFSGTVFQDTSGKVFMAMRGTQPTAYLTDWPTNIADIGSDGIAIDQGIAMYNWYQRLITPVGSEAVQFVYYKEISALGKIINPAWLECKKVTVEGTGENEGGGLVGKSDIAVTGHSLGGHLAMIMSRIAPDLVTSTLTFNAPRFDTNFALDWSVIPFPQLTLSTTALTCEGFFDLLSAAELENYVTNTLTGDSWALHKITNTRIEGDVVSLIGDLPGASDQLQLFSESINEGPIDAHDMKAIADALAVYDLIAQIDSNLTLDSITGILKASSNIGAYSLESVVSSLGGLLVTDFNKRTGSEYNADRDQLYQDIKDITATISKLPNQTIKSFCTVDAEGNYVPLSASEINILAQNNIAYRYALMNLNPFALIAADYSKFNKNGELDLYTSSTPDGQLSEKYLRDRANFLVQLLYENINDTGSKNPYDPMNIDVYPNLPAYYHADLATGNQSLNAVYSDLEAKKDNYQQFIFGSNEGDSDIAGGSKDDHLYGMGGNDTIKGHGGNDYIEGGLGLDIMHGGAGIDTFSIQGEDTDYDTFYGGSEHDKILGGNKSGVKDVIRLHNFNYAINSIEEINGQAGENIIAGTGDGDIIDLSGTTLNNIHAVYGGRGEDTITGGKGNYADHLYGGEGGDTLRGMDGDDHLYGTRDDLTDDNARDILEGGAGNDTYYIGAGDIINDSDQTGTIIFDNRAISSLVFIQTSPGSNSYKTQDGWYTALKDSNNTLRVGTNLEGNIKSFSIENFSTDSALSITLEDYVPPAGEFEYTWNGSEDQDISDVYQQSNPDYYNIFMFSNGGLDTLHQVRGLDDSPRMKLNGLGGNDYLFGFADSDEIHGGSGNDLIRGHLSHLLHGSNSFEVFPGDTVRGDMLYGDDGNDGIFGSMADDVLDGGGDNDIISGYNGDDTIIGGLGRDILFGSAGGDTIEGGDGNDALYGYGAHQTLEFDDLVDPAWSLSYQDGYLTGCSINFSVYLNEYIDEAGDDTLSGGAGDDFLAGGGGADNLFGGADQDSLSGGIGNDYLEGNDGNDVLFGDNGDNVENVNDGIDYLYGGAGVDYLYGQGNHDFLYGDDNEDYLIGGGGNDTLFGGRDADYLYGDMGDGTGSGADILYGGSGDDYLYGHGGNDVLHGGDGVDELQGNLGNDELHGGDDGDYLYGDNGLDGSGGGNDILYGDVGNDYLYGHGGDDILIGGYGADLLVGGSGKNRYIFDTGHGSGTLADTIIGDASSENSLEFNGVSIGDVEVAFSHEDNGLTIWYSATDRVFIDDGAVNTNYTFSVDAGAYDYETFLNTVMISRSGTDGADVLSGSNYHETMYGGWGNDIIYGYGGNDSLNGEQGNDTLYGGAGDDILTGGAGANELYGEEGNDHYVFTGLPSGYSVITDTQGINLIEIQDEISDVSIDYVARQQNGSFVPNPSGTHLQINSLTNGDTIVVTDGSLNTAFSYRFNGQAYDLEDILQCVNITLYGDDQDNILHGNSGHDTLFGGGGNDYLNGHNGNDSLYGEGDNDILIGENGNDLLEGGNGDDLLIGGRGADKLYGGYGVNTISYADETEDITVELWTTGIGGSAEGDTYKDIENIIGGKGDDHLVGSRYGGVIEGGKGADFLDGGWDWMATASYRTSSAGVTVNLTTGEAFGGDAEGDRLTGFQGLIGSAYNDTLVCYYDYYAVLSGLAGDDILHGGEEGDKLDGGTGNDSLYGGEDSDRYYINSGSGRDFIYDSIGSYEEVTEKDRFGHNTASSVWIEPDAGRDGIIFGEGISSNDLLLYRTPEGEGGGLGNDDFVIALKEPDKADASWDQLENKIVIKNFFNHEERPEINIYEKYDARSSENLGKYVGSRLKRYGNYSNHIDYLEFSDGTTVNTAEIVASLTTGTNGNDHLENLHGDYSYSTSWQGYKGNDIMIGGNSSDLLYGGEGADTLDGREGNNLLDGGSGDDTYIASNRNLPIAYNKWNGGRAWGELEGVDTISDEEGHDKLLFKNDIAREDIIFTLNTDGDLLIDYGLAQQFQIKISGNSIEEFQMTDGSSITRDQVMIALQSIADIRGVAIHEITNMDIRDNIELKSELYNSWQDQYVIYNGHDDWNDFNGNSDNETVFGGAGIDSLLGHCGNDILHGAGSDDFLNAGNGNDTYEFGRGNHNDTIHDKEIPFITDSYGSFQIDDGIYEDLQTWTTLTEVHPNQAPSNDTLQLTGDIQRQDLEMYWAAEGTSGDEGDDLLIRIKSDDDSGTWHIREKNIDAIVQYYNAKPLKEAVFNSETQEYENVDRVLTADDFDGHSDKALRYLAYQLLEGNDDISDVNMLEEVMSFLDNENDAVDFKRMYRSSEDTIFIRDYYNRSTTIENISLSSINYTLTNDDIMDLMSTDNSEMIRGVNWAENTIFGKGGNDIIFAGDLNDSLHGGAGNDLIYGSIGADVINGSDGQDTVDYSRSSEGVSVNLTSGYGKGNLAEGDRIASIENIIGSEFNDVLSGDSEDNNLRGKAGTDNLQGRDGEDRLYGGSGNDFFRGGAGADILDGGEDRDIVDYRDSEEGVLVDLAAGTAEGGTAAGDIFFSIENIYGSEFEDTLTGNIENNTLLGFAGNDALYGLDGNDNLQGRDGEDRLYSGSGTDSLQGGAGSDILTGGEGNDRFIFNTAFNDTEDTDTIVDFTIDEDRIILHSSVFSALIEEGVLAEASFSASATGAAADENDYILYNTSNGSLLYDFDGNGQGVAVEFAKLTTKPEVTNKDFVVVA